MTKKVSILLLIDGNSLFHRAYHALPPITDKSGEVANAVFGFSNMLIKAINETKPDYIACAFDTKAPTFRHVEFEQYKAQRVEPPADLYPQLPKVKKVLDAFGIKFFEKEGYEADDLIATIVSKAIVADSPSVILSEAKESQKKIATSTTGRTRNDKVDQVIILSSDRDVLQLVDGNIKVQMPGWNLKETSLYGATEVKEKFGLEPYQMVDFKSLTGDPSDNIPGISGVGPKTASTLLQKYHTLENLFKHVKETPLKVKQKLEAGEGAALAAKKLVELDRDVAISFKLSELNFSPDWGRVRREYEELGFKSIVAKLPGSKKQDGVSQNSEQKTDNQDQLELI
ncbi:hypothetical protein A2696_01360 [Candidatus Curtissbacteria bacterium RIFCSPHIGHO2_01_FULL_41_13]|uniref:5'-3' exonuclease domain-containing protein n=1 Tax=Candidatus Curtissbacteria bacterium RIFCSPHIGHO2_01_FULL_41_13 TaxID=1797745 RepID=A0A1F5FXZ4_9BACT|nr:MAG: hypothetical protein A2696_01360 [Candidatus Curtissbacteria bacterium RIFCSPHIGHO2_01_FULL_41_13]